MARSSNCPSSANLFLFSTCFYILLLLLDFPGKAVSQSIVRYLPGFGPLPFEFETGYVNVDDSDGVELFYYFFKSENDPINDPLLFWFAGGPGCSGLTTIMIQIGPLSFRKVEYNGSLPTLVLNPNSWTKMSNIVFLDAPVGTGFSYSRSLQGYPSSDTKSAKHSHTFIRKWLVGHPEFLSNPLYLAGDSYSGIVVPLIVKEISDAIEAGDKPLINLQGYLLGNPVTDQNLEKNSVIPFSYGMGLISLELFKSANKYCGGEYINVDPSNAQCKKDLEAVTECTEGLDTEFILDPKCFSRIDENQIEGISDRRLLRENTSNIIRSPPSDPGLGCRKYDQLLLYYWTNDDQVQTALNVRKGKVPEWIRCMRDKLDYLSDVETSTGYHLYLSKKHYRSLIFSGDHDMVVPFIGTQAWIKSLKHSISDEWRPWFVDSQVAGYTRAYSSNMTYATIKGAGHIASVYKPKECLTMVLKLGRNHASSHFKVTLNEILNCDLSGPKMISNGKDTYFNNYNHNHPTFHKILISHENEMVRIMARSSYHHHPFTLANLMYCLFSTCFCCILFFLVLDFPANAVSQSIVEYLPGFGRLPFELETGYVTVDDSNGVEFFYYFFKSESNPIKDPLLFWFTGGPGCSGLTTIMTEIGPLSFKNDNYNGSLPTLIAKPDSWTKVANIVFLDAPVDSGFSYSTTLQGSLTSDTIFAKQSHTFIRKWLLGHHDFLSNPLYVAGDSYAGKFVPIIVQHVSDGIEAGEKPVINLKGYVLGNPVTDGNLEGNSLIPFAYGMGIISYELFESAKKNCRGNYVNVDPSNVQCRNDLQAFTECIEGICVEYILDSYSGANNIIFPAPKDMDLGCTHYGYLPLDYWANDYRVQAALNVRKGMEWVRCKYEPDIHYLFNVESSIGYHLYLSKKSYRSLIYSGDHDMVVPFMSTQAWIRSLNLSIRDEWRQWYVEGQVAGYTRTYSNNLTYATVKGAGHTAPEYKPAECFVMIKRWLSYEPL